MDKIQHNMYPDLETTVRNWETSSEGYPLPNSYNPPIIGSVSAKDQYGRLVIGPDQGVYDATHFFSGWNQGNHPTVYYMMKSWDKYYYYDKTGEYVHSDNINDNKYSSASVYLYKYVIVNEYYMRNIVYFTNNLFLPEYDASSYSHDYQYGLGYVHEANTFLNTPDGKVSNINARPNASTEWNPFLFDSYVSPSVQYFELVSGYPKNHYTHKMQQFSKYAVATYASGLFVKGKQTTDFTVNSSGIKDGSYPVQSSNVSNVNVINGSNVIQNVPSSNAGRATPSPTGPGSVTF
jgi:hypothetical protein